MELQVEVSIKIGKLMDIDASIGRRYASIIQNVDFADLPIPTGKPTQATTTQPSHNKYSPNPTFLEQGGNKDRTKPWYTTASDLMTESDITIIQEWLLSGGPYTMYSEPTRFLKLLLDEETSRVLNTMLLGKYTGDNCYIDIENIVDNLDELISSQKTMSTRRKEFFGSYNTPRLIGKEGNKIDGFVTQLSRDIAA